MKLRFVHAHERDQAEVERLVAFAGEPLARSIGPVLVAVKVQASKHEANSGCAYPQGDTPRWAGRARYATTLSVPVDRPEVRYGQPRVCYHASSLRDTYKAPTGVPDVVKSAAWQVHSTLWHMGIAEAFAAGATHHGRWPIYYVLDWREGLIHLAAHELRHVAQFANGRRRSEVDCETFALARLLAFRATV